MFLLFNIWNIFNFFFLRSLPSSFELCCFSCSFCFTGRSSTDCWDVILPILSTPASLWIEFTMVHYSIKQVFACIERDKGIWNVENPFGGVTLNKGCQIKNHSRGWFPQLPWGSWGFHLSTHTVAPPCPWCDLLRQDQFCICSKVRTNCSWPCHSEPQSCSWPTTQASSSGGVTPHISGPLVWACIAPWWR